MTLNGHFYLLIYFSIVIHGLYMKASIAKDPVFIKSA
jgi:hypothetical protein